MEMDEAPRPQPRRFAGAGTRNPLREAQPPHPLSGESVAAFHAVGDPVRERTETFVFDALGVAE